MSTAATETQEENRGRIGREDVNRALPSGMSTAALMDPSLSPAEERPTKKFPAHSIRRRIVEAATIYLSAVSDTVFQRRTAVVATAESYHGEGQKAGISTKRK